MSHTFDFFTQWLEPSRTGAPAADTGNPARLISKLTAARALRQLRAKVGLSQEQLATRLDLPMSDMVAIEIGEADFLRTLQVAERARKLLGVR